MQVTGPALYFLKVLGCARKQPVLELLDVFCPSGFGKRQEQELRVRRGLWLQQNPQPAFPDDVMVRPSCTVAFGSC